MVALYATWASFMATLKARDGALVATDATVSDVAAGQSGWRTWASQAVASA